MATTPSIRGVLKHAWRPVAAQLAELVPVTAQSEWAKLAAGQPLTLHRDQLDFGHPDMPDLSASEWWLLTGESTLTPTGAP